MGARGKYSSILLYNKLLREISVANKQLPENKKLSLAERREIVSKKLYPKYKGKRLKITEVRGKVAGLLKKVKRKEDCDILAIPAENINSIEYYAINELIEQILPKCIFVKVDAAEYGETNIFNTREYKYYSSGVSEITNKINTDLPRRKSDDIPYYDGTIQVRKKKKNDGNSDSYYIHFILKYPGISQTVLKKFDLPKIKKSTKKQATAQNVKKKIAERVKALKQKKSKVKAIRYSFNSQISGFKKISKRKSLKPFRDALKKQLLKDELKRAKKFFDKKQINKRQYGEIVRSIEAAYK